MFCSLFERNGKKTKVKTGEHQNSKTTVKWIAVLLFSIYQLFFLQTTLTINTGVLCALDVNDSLHVYKAK